MIRYCFCKGVLEFCGMVCFGPGDCGSTQFDTLFILILCCWSRTSFQLNSAANLTLRNWSAANLLLSCSSSSCFLLPPCYFLEEVSSWAELWAVFTGRVRRGWLGCVWVVRENERSKRALSSFMIASCFISHLEVILITNIWIYCTAHCMYKYRRWLVVKNLHTCRTELTRLSFC